LGGLSADFSGAEPGDTGETAGTERVIIADKRYRARSGARTFGESSIWDWEQQPDGALLLRFIDRGSVRITFARPCRKLPYTESIALLVNGPFSLEQTTTILLPDGERCQIKGMEELGMGENR